MDHNHSTQLKIAFLLRPPIGDSIFTCNYLYNLSQLFDIKITAFNSALNAIRNKLPFLTAETQEAILSHPERQTEFDLFFIDCEYFDKNIFTNQINIVPYYEGEPSTTFKINPEIYSRLSSQKKGTLKLIENLNPECMVIPSKKLKNHAIYLAKLFCEQKFPYEKFTKYSMAGFSYKKYKNRIAVAPGASKAGKRWATKKFYRLEEILEKKGFTVNFLVPNNEKQYWKKVLNPQKIIADSLEHNMEFIYESGFFIGNDSGMGHLAASMQIPTLSIWVMRRKNHMEIFRPNVFNNSKVIYPLLHGKASKKKQCRPCLLSAEKVANYFLKNFAT